MPQRRALDPTADPTPASHLPLYTVNPFMWPHLCVCNLPVESRYLDASTVWRRRVRPLDHGG